MRVLTNPGGPIARMEFTADGRLFTASRWGVRLWDVASGESRLVIDAEAPTAWLCGGDEAARIIRGKILRIDLAAGKAVGERRDVPGGQLRAPCYSAKAGLIAAASMWGYDIHFWPLPDLEPRTTWEAEDLGGVTCLPDLAFSPDGGHIASIDDQKEVALRVSATGERVWGKAVPGVSANGILAFSADGRYLAAASGTHLTVLAARDGEKVASARLTRKHFQQIAFTPCGRFLAGVSKEATVKVYETASWSLRHELAWEIGPLKHLAFSPDGMLGAASGGETIVVWDVDW